MKTKKEKRSWYIRFRSAITGMFVSKEKAEADPDHTYSQKIENNQNDKASH